MADFYFTDRKYNQLGIASTDELASSSVIAIDDIGGQEGDYQSVDGGYRSYSATLHFSPDQSAQVKEMTKPGNFILYKGRDGESVWTTILSREHDPLSGTNAFVAEDASIDLINGTVGAYAASSAMTIAQYIELFAGDSGFVIGYNEIPDLTRTLKWDSDDSSILARILSVATQFGVELSFRFEVRGLSVIGKYIDIRKHIGGNKGIYLRVDTDLNKIVTTSDIADLCTAIAGTGGTPEGSNDPITLKGYRWTDPNGRYVLGGDGVLRDPVALRTWSRLLSNTNTNPVDAHITRNKTYEATTQATLIQSVLSDLEKFNHPAVNYEVDIAKLPDNVSIGDTVYLVDEDEQLFLSARVLELTYSYSNESGTATLGDYLIQASQIDPAYRELADQIKNIKTVQYYPWIRYADDDKGTNMSAFPANKKYMAFRYSEKSSVPSDNPADYAGRWALIRGKDGADGVPGAKGADGRTSYFHTAWANDVSGQSGFTVSGGDGKKYIGTYSDFTKADSTNPTDYNWALFKGADGDVGPKGDQGLPGAKGADGRTSYAHFAYANSQDGHADFSTTDPNRKYIGFYSDFKSGDSTNPSDYSWSLIKGADGADGKEGVPGKPGADGKTSYFHIAYADSGDGRTNFSLDTPGSRKYIGSYTDFTREDSNNPAVYSWQLVQGPQGPKGDSGADGLPGKNGVGLATTTVTYQASISGTTVPSGTWSTSVPSVSKGQYLWTRTVWMYTDKSSEVGYSVAYVAKDGNSGKDGIAGKDGVGIKSTVIEYAVSSSGVTKPSTGWSSSIPDVTPGQFFWTRTTWAYTDGTNEVGYSVAQAGKNGERGKQIFKSNQEYEPNSSEHWWSDLSPAPSIDNPPKTGDTIVTPSGNIFQIDTVIVGGVGGGGTFGVKNVLGNIRGPQGPQGPQGVPGSKDVPYSHIQLGTPQNPKKGDLWWHGTTLNDATALQYYNGSTWIDQSIQQAVLSIKKLQSIEIDSAIINSPMINVPFTHASIEGGGIKSTGKLSLNGTSYSIDGNIEDSDGKPNGQNYHTELNPDGLLSYLTETDGTTQKDISRISMGTLELSHLVSGLGTSANYITSSLNALAIARLNNVGALLWEGTSLMGWSGNAQGATPSKPISDCLNGWLLVWSEYKDGVPQDYDYIVTPIYRVFVQAHPGRQLSLPMVAYGATSFNKKVYPTNTNIVGDKNNSGGAGNPSIAGNYVLVNIFAF
ncbi:phage tail spike protein [Lacticaseibacillus paracasei]|uniref:phage tail spike protein n=1 Tax=Lacticaseibacillus paracasei TaxID=1597 RepID=UPI0015FE6882|nr:phage tail spike protein [Lacticaseibacillus paracasei]MBB1167291.1 antifreeze protein [Lacticaseibacillus paracasei]